MEITPADFRAIRHALASLPRAENHTPGQSVERDAVFTPRAHRNVLDPDRTLVVGNRGMGKTFWSHALLDSGVREAVGRFYGQSVLATLQAVIGFNGSSVAAAVAPALDELLAAQSVGIDSEVIWRAVLLRAVTREIGRPSDLSFVDQCRWVAADLERYTSVVSQADSWLAERHTRLLLIFDALDLLGRNSVERRDLTRALLARALAARSYRSIRFKLFMRPDQYADQTLFSFPDASKIKNDRVDLTWTAADLYGLLFLRLQQSQIGREPFSRLKRSASLAIFDRHSDLLSRAEIETSVDPDFQKPIVDAIAGEFMGSNLKRGRTYTWLPTHLGDARGETSPRTFLTAWQVAALHEPAPTTKSIDYVGLSEGVRRASEDRLAELEEDYPWIKEVLKPLAGESVPMEWEHLQSLWKRWGTVPTIVHEFGWSEHMGGFGGRLATEPDQEPALLESLCTIGVFERRVNQKVNVPDIFRVEARIKRKGGVKPPRGFEPR